MERNLLQPQAEIKNLFTKHFQNLMETYRIQRYLFLSNSDDGSFLSRGSPPELSELLIRTLEDNADLRKIVVQFLRKSNLMGGDPE